MNIAELKEVRNRYLDEQPAPEVNTGQSQPQPEVKAKKESTIDKVKEVNKDKSDVQVKSLKLAESSFEQNKKQTKFMETQLAESKQQSMTLNSLNQSMGELLRLMTSQANKLEVRKQGFAANDEHAEVIGQSKEDMFGNLGSMFGDLMGDLLGGGRRRGGRYGRDRGRNPRNRRNRNKRRSRRPSIGKRPGRFNPKSVMDAAKRKVASAKNASRTTAVKGARAAKDVARTAVDKSTTVAKSAANYGAGKVTTGAQAAKAGFTKLPVKGKAGIVLAAAAGIGALGTSIFGGSDEEEPVVGTPKTLGQPGQPKVSTYVDKHGRNVTYTDHTSDFDKELMARRAKEARERWSKPLPEVDPQVNDKVTRLRPQGPVKTGDTVRYPEQYTTPSVKLGASTDKPNGLRPSSITQTGMDSSSLKFGTEMMSAAELSAFLKSDKGQTFGIKADNSASFISSYAKVAGERAEELKTAQQSYLHDSAYLPQLAKASTVAGLDLGTRGSAVQEMLYANGRRFGAGDSSVGAALQSKDVGSMTDEEIIKVVYDYKMNILPKKFSDMQSHERMAMQKELAAEGSKLLSMAATDSTQPFKMLNNAVSNIRNVNASGASAMMQAPPAAVNMAVASQSTPVLNSYAGSAGGGTAGASTGGGDGAANKDEAVMTDPKAGAMYAIGLKHVILNHGRVDMQGLHPNFKKAFYTMVGDWVTNRSGTKVYVESAFRTRADQERLWIKYGKNTKRVARPGTSRHESGFAIDIDRKSAASLDSSGMFSKYGFHRPLSHEPWHVEMTAAGRNKPVEEPEVNVSTSTPVEAAGEPASEVAAADPNVGTTPSATTEDVDPMAVSEGAATASTAAAVTAAAAVVAGGVALSKSTDEAGAVDAGAMETKTKADKAKAAEAKAKGTPKVKGGLMSAGKKALPVVGTALTAVEAVSIITDDEMTTKEKGKAGTELAGGTAGAIVGGKAGAAGGAAVGAMFFGVGAVPGALIGGIVGSVAGYLTGSYAAGEVYDAIDDRINEGAEQVKEEVDKVEAVTPVVGPDGEVALVPEAKAPKATTPSEVKTSPASATKSPEAVTGKTIAPTPTAESEPLSLEGEALAAQARAASAYLSSSSAETGPISLEAEALAAQARAASAYLSSTSALSPSSALSSTIAEASTMSPEEEAVAAQFRASRAHMDSVEKKTGKASMAPVKIPAPVTSPASPEFYKAEDISIQSSGTTKNSPVTQTVAPSIVARTETSQQKVERQQYEPVKQVMALQPQQQDTSMPNRFKPQADRTPSRGISSSDSQRQTIEDCPAVIADGGLIFIQTGYI